MVPVKKFEFLYEVYFLPWRRKKVYIFHQKMDIRKSAERRTYVTVRKYNRHYENALPKNVPNAHRFCLWNGYILPLPKGDDAREKAHQSGMLLSAYLKVGKKQKNEYVTLWFSVVYFFIKKS